MREGKILCQKLKMEEEGEEEISEEKKGGKRNDGGRKKKRSIGRKYLKVSQFRHT